MRNLENAFETSEFYTKVEEGTREGLLQALDLIGTSVNLNLVSYRAASKGWTYLHYVVDRYQVRDRVKKKCRTTKLIYTRTYEATCIHSAFN